jgi:hypothetical protein
VASDIGGLVQQESLTIGESNIGAAPHWLVLYIGGQVILTMQLVLVEVVSLKDRSSGSCGTPGAKFRIQPGSVVPTGMTGQRPGLNGR